MNELKIGIAIGTYGTPAFIHLHLEIAKRLYPSKILVIDDNSKDTDKLRELCNMYNVEFLPNSGNPAVKEESNKDPRTGGISVKHCLGDLSITASALTWAKDNNFPLLVKFSRRFIPLYDWRGELQRIAACTGYPAYSSWESYFRFLMKTEAIGFNVNDWFVIDSVNRLKAQRDPVLVEHFIFEESRKIWKDKCARNKAYAYTDAALYGDQAGEHGFGYGIWHIGGIARNQRLPWRLWHSANPPKNYLDIAENLGIKGYTENDFAV
jgi:hypothetical protein